LTDQNNTLIGQNERLYLQFQFIIEQNRLLDLSIESLNSMNEVLSTQITDLSARNTELSGVISNLTTLITAGNANDNAAINALIAERDALIAEINTLIAENAELRVQIELANTANNSNNQSGGSNETTVSGDFTLIDGRFAIRMGFWEAHRPFINSIAIAAYGDTRIASVEILTPTGIWVDNSRDIGIATGGRMQQNRAFKAGVMLWNNEIATLRITTNHGVYVVEVGLQKAHVNVFQGMQQNWESFRLFYVALNG